MRPIHYPFLEEILEERRLEEESQRRTERPRSPVRSSSSVSSDSSNTSPTTRFVQRQFGLRRSSSQERQRQRARAAGEGTSAGPRQRSPRRRGYIPVKRNGGFLPQEVLSLISSFSPILDETVNEIIQAIRKDTLHDDNFIRSLKSNIRLIQQNKKQNPNYDVSLDPELAQELATVLEQYLEDPINLTNLINVLYLLKKVVVNLPDELDRDTLEKILAFSIGNEYEYFADFKKMMKVLNNTINDKREIFDLIEENLMPQYRRQYYDYLERFGIELGPEDQFEFI